MAIRLPRLHRRLIYTFFALSWVTGITFFVLNTWITVEGEFGPEKHPWQLAVLKTHGAAAFLMMINFGALLSAHVPKGWRVRRMRLLGSLLTGALALMIITAYLLYYLGNEEIRQVVAYIHGLVGLCLPLLLLAHLRQGRSRSRRQRLKRRIADAPTSLQHPN